MLGQDYNKREIESFIESYFKEYEKEEAEVTLQNGGAYVKMPSGPRILNANDISKAISIYFESQNVRVREINSTNNSQSPLYIEVTQLNRSDVKTLKMAA